MKIFFLWTVYSLILLYFRLNWYMQIICYCLYKYIIQGHSLRGMFNVFTCHSKILKRSISLNCRKVIIVTSSVTNGVIVSLKKIKGGFYNAKVSNQVPLRSVKSVCCRNRIQRRLFRLIYAYEGLAASTPVKTMPEDL